MWGMLASEFSAGGFCSELIFMVVLYVVLVGVVCWFLRQGVLGCRSFVVFEVWVLRFAFGACCWCVAGVWILAVVGCELMRCLLVCLGLWLRVVFFLCV